MTLALISVVVLLLGLPLLAWWVGGRRFWSRLRPKASSDLYREVVLRYRLNVAETGEVQQAMFWGRELQDPRLRAALVHWATELRADREQRRAHPGRRGILVLAVVIWLITVLGTVSAEVASGRWGGLMFSVVNLFLCTMPVLQTARGQKLALERNSGPPLQSAAEGVGSAAAAGREEGPG